jgi:hypothetical protein
VVSWRQLINQFAHAPALMSTLLAPPAAGAARCAAPRRRCATRCAAAASEPAPLARRTALAAAAAAALLLPGRRAAAADGDDAPVAWSRYTRAFRERFETSISSATRAYTFEYPSSWGPEVVSLNDGKLYGVDLRLRNKAEGQLAVSLLPYGAGVERRTLSRERRRAGAASAAR